MRNATGFGKVSLTAMRVEEAHLTAAVAGFLWGFGSRGWGGEKEGLASVQREDSPRSFPVQCQCSVLR